MSGIHWVRFTWKDGDITWVGYTATTERKRCEIRLYGDEHDGDCDLLMEVKVREATRRSPAKWECVSSDRTVFESFDEAKKRAGLWLNH